MKIYIWGIGRLAGKVVGKYILLDDIEGFIDNDDKVKEFLGKKVLKPSEMIGIEYDAIIVANLYSKDIYEQCLEIGLEMNKMIFVYANCQLTDFNTDYNFVAKIMGKEYADVIQNRYHVVRDLEMNETLVMNNVDVEKYKYKKTDWVRIKTFELIVKEINKKALKGNVAELGVFKGEFAQFINSAFPDDKLYLFDTFEGFNTNEALNEMKRGNCTRTFVEAYKNTSIVEVLNKMENEENIEIVKGYFPQSLNGLEDEFKFVSLDCDFEESIYEGLKYFYPRLVKGGYIFVHDYNSLLTGVEEAIIRYEREFGSICKVPICDANGTIIISK